jgi:hypothetical protein
MFEHTNYNPFRNYVFLRLCLIKIEFEILKFCELICYSYKIKNFQQTARKI